MVRRLTADNANRSLAAGVVRSVLLAICGVGVMATALARLLGLGAGYPMRAVIAFLIGLVIVLPQLVGRPHPFPDLGPANHVSIVRGVLTALLAALVGEAFAAGAGYFIIAAGAVCLVLDGVDGRLARATRMTSELGARLDMETDALLAVVLSVLAWRSGRAGAWVLLCGLLRYAFVAAAWIMPRLRRALPESRRRKAICVAMLIGLLAALAPFIPPPWSAVPAALATAILLYSFFVDTLWLVRRAPSAG